MFLEHDDIYQGGGHQHIILGPKIIEAPKACRSNHEVICALARRLGAEHPGFDMTEWELIDQLMTASGWDGAARLKEQHWIDCQPDFETSHYLTGFAHADGKFRFRPDWSACKPHGFGAEGGSRAMPEFPDHWPVIEAASEEYPFRLVTAPARDYLNSSFTETPTSQKKEGKPTAKIHPEDARTLGIADGALARLGNARGTVLIHTEVSDVMQPGVVIVESIWPNAAFQEGVGINALTGADPCSPVGGAAFHDSSRRRRRT
jgi:anaerobic selenocysteine-containing dehydrogenase